MPPSSLAPALPHLRGFDGLRAGAVLAVLLAHWPHPHWRLAGGWVGVQVFFVLSGFLITRLLVADRARPLGAFLRRFYWRRALRIFPLYYGYLLLVGGGLLALAAAGVTAAATGALAARTDAPWLLTYLYNWQDLIHWLDGRPDSESSRFFNHLWSLSVEEQFYLGFPLVVWSLPPARLRQVLLALVLAGPLLRLGVGEWLRGVSAPPLTWAFFLHRATIFHLDALALGGLLALGAGAALRHPGRWLLAALLAGAAWNVGWPAARYAVLGLAWPSLSWLGYWHPLEEYAAVAGAPTWLRLSWALTPSVVAGQAALLLLWVRRGNPTALRWLDRRPARFVGRISYGIYVWHMPLTLLVARGPVGRWLSGGWAPELAGLLLYLMGCGVVAAGSYYGFEQFFLRLKEDKRASVARKGAF